MIEYRINFAVGMLDKTWFEQEVVVLNEDEGDIVAIEMGEAQIRNSFDKSNYPVAFIALLSIWMEEEKVEGEELSYRAWLKTVRKLAHEAGKEFELNTAVVAWQKDYTPAGFVNTFAYPAYRSEVDDD